MNMRESKWIWLNGEEQADSYGEFCTSFIYQGGLRATPFGGFRLYTGGLFSLDSI